METQELDKAEKAHHITSTVYKDLQVNFTQGLKAIWSSGKALHKSLEVSSQKAKVHYDAITMLGQAASQSEGTVIGIGHALMQMAEIYKEIQHQADENIAALKKELCNPFEFILLDNGEKMEDKLKKYNKEHYKLQVPYKKAAANLHKHRKKGKGSIQNPKEMQYFREATEYKQRLDRYRFKHLKDALFEEKKNYLFAFEKLVTVAQNYTTESRKAQELLGHRIPDWEELTQSKDMSKDALKIIESIIDTDSADVPENNNGNIHNEHLDLDSSSSLSGSLPRSSNDPLPSLPPPNQNADKPKVRALYSHDGEGDNQLAFMEDDIILLYGNKRDGWHYGQNNRTKAYGWFPISFTETIRRKNSLQGDSTSKPNLSSMAKYSRSVADLTGGDERSSTIPHQRQLQFDFSDRSTMTLPNKKKASGVGFRGLPPDISQSHSQSEQMKRAGQWVCNQIASSSDTNHINPTYRQRRQQHLHPHRLIKPPNPSIGYSPSNSYHISPAKYSSHGGGDQLHHQPNITNDSQMATGYADLQSNTLLQQKAAYDYALYRQQLIQWDHYNQQLASQANLAPDLTDLNTKDHSDQSPLFNRDIPPLHRLFSPMRNQTQGNPSSPPLPPPPSDFYSGAHQSPAVSAARQTATLPQGFRASHGLVSPMSPPPPPPPNTNQMVTMGNPNRGSMSPPSQQQIHLSHSPKPNMGSPPPPPSTNGIRGSIPIPVPPPPPPQIGNIPRAPPPPQACTTPRAPPPISQPGAIPRAPPPPPMISR